jgi:type 2 lantibiotic biosynthesis protein LanM
MDAFYERLIVRAATIDELLSDDFEPVPGQKDDADLAARRLAAWCRSSASGDWSLFGRRLERDGLSTGQVLTKFATVRRKAFAASPAWIDDAIWIEQALQQPAKTAKSVAALDPAAPCAFEQLFAPVVDQAEALLWSGIDATVAGHLTGSARAGLCQALLKELSGLAAPAIYERLAAARKAARAAAGTPARYDRFVADMKSGGLRRLFEDKPVLLRLLATLTRQWIETSREFVLRLAADLAAIRRDLLPAGANGRVVKVERDISDPHNGGRSVHIVSFEDGARVVYKPKDLRLDIAWHGLIGRLNRADPPVELRAVRALARDGYGWSEFIVHVGCDQQGCERFFRRAGGWLALFHCFAASDMHQENMIAAGDHPVPIDLETVLQAAPEKQKVPDPEDQAFDAASELLANSVMMVGMLPAYARSPDNKVFAIGGMTADWGSKITIAWENMNSDEMRPARVLESGKSSPNLPHVDGRYAKFADHIGSFVAGFQHYAQFLLHRSRDANLGGLFDGFAGAPVRKVIRPTRFYVMLLQRLKNHRSMDDGVAWSAQADFIARLAEWDDDCDSLWPAQRAERATLIAMNVPHFVSPSDGNDICDAAGFLLRTKAASGLDRARARVRSLDKNEIGWQIDVIEANTRSTSKPAASADGGDAQSAASVHADAAPTKEVFTAEAARIAAELARRAIRRGPGAAWIGLDWLGDAEVFQLVCLGPDLYNGVSGIALFLAAHAAVTGSKPSRELALAAVAHLRKSLKSEVSR